MGRPVLIVQIRPETEAADDEFAAFLRFGELTEDDVVRVRAEQVDMSEIDPQNYSAVIVGGGPFNISDTKKSSVQQRIEAELKRIVQKVIENDIPYLGACYGLGLLVKISGGRVGKERYSEGVKAVKISLSDQAKNDKLLSDLPHEFQAFGGHKESVQELPGGCTLLASSKTCPVHMIRFKNNIYGTQFHPELDTNGLITRINVYKHAGYFKPEEADGLIADAKKQSVTIPPKILKNFIDLYYRSE